jgi:exodeoxyribonuclease VII small subunit
MPKNRDVSQDLPALLKLTPAEIQALPYETAMEKLEVVVAALETEGTQLELGLKLYELGVGLSKRCGFVLDATEEKMVQLLGDAKNPTESDFDPEKDGR